MNDVIKAPKNDRRIAARRAIVEALAQATPLTAGLARLYQTTHPSQFELEVEEFFEIVAEELNNLNSTPAVRAFGELKMSAVGPTVEGCNISSVTDNGDTCTINFINDFEDNRLHVSATQIGGDARVASKGLQSFEVDIADLQKGPLTFIVIGDLA
jgi:hypothetical protein